MKSTLALLFTTLILSACSQGGGGASGGGGATPPPQIVLKSCNNCTPADGSNDADNQIKIADLTAPLTLIVKDAAGFSGLLFDGYSGVFSQGEKVKSNASKGLKAECFVVPSQAGLVENLTKDGDNFTVAKSSLLGSGMRLTFQSQNTNLVLNLDCFPSQGEIQWSVADLKFVLGTTSILK